MGFAFHHKGESMENQTTTMNLLCELSEDEIRDRAFRAGQIDQDIQIAEDAFDEVKKEHKAEVGTLESARRTLLREIREKQTRRDVTCDVVKVYSPDFQVITTRRDTGEVVHQRAMTMDERQGQLRGINGASEATA